jgi:chromosome partitioning protein
MPVVIAFSNQKGGVGKTTISSNVAGIFAAKGLETLLIDADPQCNATSFLLPRLPSAENKIPNISMIYQAEICTNPGLMITTRLPKLSIIAGGFTLAGTVAEVYAQLGSHGKLRRYLESYAQDYDVIVIDCPPDIGIFTINAFCAANYVVVPMLPERLSIDGFDTLQEKIALITKLSLGDPNLLGVVISLYSGTQSTHKLMKKEITTRFGESVLGIVHSASDFRKSAVMRNLLCEGDKNQRPYREMLLLTTAIAAKTGLIISV